MEMSSAIEEYLGDHEGGNHSPKTIEWHQTSLGLLCLFLQQKRSITLVEEVEPADLAAWFTHLRTSRGSRGKQRTERTVQTYARSARAFFHWLERRGFIQENPFAQVVFPKVGRPLIQTITDEEFERLLHACVPGTQTLARPLVERMIARNRAILWLLYDSGIRASELLDLRVGDLDRKQGLITVRGKGRKERRIALGQNCLHQVLLYLDGHRPDAEELVQWEAEGEDHLFLSELRQPLTKNGLEMLFARLRKRAGITGKRISPHILRHTFAVRYLILGNDPFSLQQLLGHEDLTTVKHYMHMNDDLIQEQKRKYSPGDHPSIALPGIRETRQKGFLARGKGKTTRA
jgi:integrase/recombinase XerD